MDSLRELLLTAYGQSKAFNMLDENTNEPVAEIQAAKQTGEMLQQTLKQAIVLLPKQ